MYFSMIDNREREIKIQRILVVRYLKSDLASERSIRSQRGYMAKSVKDNEENFMTLVSTFESKFKY